MKSADEFYCAMGQLSQEMLQFTTPDSNKLIKVYTRIVQSTLELVTLYLVKNLDLVNTFEFA